MRTLDQNHYIYLYHIGVGKWVGCLRLAQTIYAITIILFVFFIYFEHLDYLWEMNGLFVFAWPRP